MNRIKDDEQVDGTRSKLKNQQEYISEQEYEETEWLKKNSEMNDDEHGRNPHLFRRCLCMKFTSRTYTTSD